MQRYALGSFLLLILALVAASCSGGPDPTDSPSPTATRSNVRTLAEVTLRAGPGSDYDAVAQLAKDTPVTLLGIVRGRDCANWVRVETAAGDEGWVVPVLVNVDAEKSRIPPAPLPTAETPPTPVPDTCSGDLALVQIDNNVGKTLEVYMAGPEQGFSFSIDDGGMSSVCVVPGEYCYDLTDGNKHQTGRLFFPGGDCTCWHWGGARPSTGSCRCSDDPGAYQRP